ncbi:MULTISPECIES: deoxyribonuclease [Streptococcus]|uniref:Deoxyribonuclease n=1 Tax=Streptococcus macedonicus TaxID=59310 RepID=A0A2I1YHQ8_STRMC|nr:MULTISPECIES: deoxyribonuclease [Streptococcus]PLA54408.1 deoxyribonuclease [Streptococcus macedonicus]MDU6119202.1 deoxyribonuclease [Streptococcus sp.]MDV5119685.1 deoxyribonuclease [Streptococcus pasteurianus]QCE37025.1 deoxyribonuclease [Streptococcus pasteurianus]RGB46329.1 deoxyribonuclease [Streptococcus gallolyticus]
MPSNTNFNNVLKMKEQTAISCGKHDSEKEKYN